jgi:hypothetical protein
LLEAKAKLVRLALPEAVVVVVLADIPVLVAQVVTVLAQAALVPVAQVVEVVEIVQDFNQQVAVAVLDYLD